ncbi:HipA domain-containing protein [Steroidobacter sp. S1-65]|uniref:HipA domain-containing protein n=1 Tax=Steroidobacter gossypii TaxID=2805490 RepID=A0ABS1X360_9GAMM|nr:HipA domain-containing protein [Steroidobacter gossypii]MBM0107656.1 HipA domain-containing protein [Steroidobacter gossypii]
MPSLAVWMNGQRVGTWSISRSGTSEFTYEQAWITSEFFRALSLSIPVSADLAVRGPTVTNYFDNLLPDSPAIRQRIGRRFKVRAETFELLQAIGRDCAGAVQLLPLNATPEGWNKVQGAELSDADMAAHLRNVVAPASRFAVDEELDGFRISLAGAQEKSAFLRMGGRWFRPEGATPTTHIVKLPMGTIAGGLDFALSVENEWLCAQFLAAMGLNVANTSMGRFEDLTVLIVERFDRRWINVEPASVNDRSFVPGKRVYLVRLPQEDFCQALGVPVERKYEKDGGPSIAQGLQLLAGGEQMEADRSHFALTQLLFWLLAAPDGHAKNFSIQHSVGGRYHLTPLYDVLSAWPLIGRGPKLMQYEKVSLAMALRGKNAHYRLNSIYTRHWFELARMVGVEGLWPRMIAAVERATSVIKGLERKLPKDFPENVYLAISKGIERHAQQFLDGLEHVKV